MSATRGYELRDDSATQVDSDTGEPTPEQVAWTKAREQCPDRMWHQPGNPCQWRGTDYDGLEAAP